MSQRQQARAMRVATHYAERRATAKTAKELALVSYQQLVARIGHLDPSEQDAAYDALARLLDNHNNNLGRSLTRVA